MKFNDYVSLVKFMERWLENCLDDNDVDVYLPSNLHETMADAAKTILDIAIEAATAQRTLSKLNKDP